MEEFIGKEVFVITSEEDTITELNFFISAAEADERLKFIEPLDEPETKVFHGILTRADSIPPDITGGTCYILIISMTYDTNCGQGIVYQSECDGDIELLAEDIEEAVTTPNYHGVFVAEIEDVYILYGYEVGTGLCINDETLDEEVVRTCKTIAVKAKTIHEEHFPDSEIAEQMGY